MQNKFKTSILSSILPSLCLAAGLFVSSPVMSSYELNSKDVKSLTISNEGLTRLTVEGDQIVDMFAYPGDLSQSLNLHESGHLFIAPAGLSETIHVTLITQRGSTQDLKIRFGKRQNKPIIFHHKDVKKVSKKQIKRWLTAALLGESPQGFHREGVFNNKRLSKWTTAKESDRFTNDDYDISIYTVSNRSSTSVKVSTDLFIEEREGGRLEKTTLEPYGKTLLAVVSKRDKKVQTKKN